MAPNWLSLRKVTDKLAPPKKTQQPAKSTQTQKTAKQGSIATAKSPALAKSPSMSPAKSPSASPPPKAAAKKRKAPPPEDSDEEIDLPSHPKKKKTPSPAPTPKKRTPPPPKKRTPPPPKKGTPPPPKKRTPPRLASDNDHDTPARRANKSTTNYRAPSVVEVDDADAGLLQVLEDLDPRAKYITRIHCDYEHVYQLARYMPRVLGAFCKVERAFIRGGALDAQEGFRDSLRPDKVWDDDVAHCHGYDLLEIHFPVLIEAEQYLRAHPDRAVKVLDFFDKVGARARGDDLSRLRHRVIEYLDPEAVDTLKVKANRGFRNVLTGRMLCPVSKLSQFDADPWGFCREVRAGNIQLHSLDWPLFLYDEDLLKAGKVRPGLLRSEFLVRTFLTLYKGPQSADRLLRDASRSTGKPSLCVKYNITEVTPDMIFYVVALVRSLLTARASWSIKDGAYNGKDFIYSLARALSSDTPFMKNLMAWWNQKVFGHVEEDNNDPDFAANRFDLEAGDEDNDDEGEEKLVDDEDEDGDDEQDHLDASVVGAHDALQQFEAEADDEQDGENVDIQDTGAADNVVVVTAASAASEREVSPV